jgi:hypothetical protein
MTDAAIGLGAQMIASCSAMTNANPASLSTIDEVEVVDLCGLAVGPGTFVTQAAGAPAVRLSGADAQRISELWRSLPPGEQARCHVPPFGLRFYSRGRLLAQGSICWRCNNIHGEAMGETLFYEFDASHKTARELLALLERAVGHPATE